MEHLKDEVYISEEEDEESSDEEIVYLENGEKSSVNIPINGSPIYPKIYVGESARPLEEQYYETESIDENINRTWVGLLTSYYG